LNPILRLFGFEAAPAITFAATPAQPVASGAPATNSPDLRIDTSIVSVERNTFGMSGSGFPRYNPDDLVKKRGLSIYSKMRVDEQVKAVVTFKRDAILSRGWTFEFDDDTKLSDTDQALRVKVFQRIIEKMPGSFIDSLNMISTGRDYGFSLTEKVYNQIEIDGKTYVGLARLIGRDPSTFEFITDPYGMLVQAQQRAGGKLILLDMAKFIHYVHNPEFDMYFGQSDLREAYRPWYFKEVLYRYWGLYMEKLGGGMIVATVAPESNLVPGSQQYRQLQDVISSMKATTSVLMPKGVTMDVHFPQTTDAFDKAIEFQDLAIAKALLVPNLMGVSHTGKTGSYSQSQTQLESFAWTVKADTDRLESCLNEQLFYDLGEQNWGDGEYPKFMFKPMGTELVRWLITTWTQLVTAGAVLPTATDEERIREIMEMPSRDPDEEILPTRSAQPAPGQPINPNEPGAPTNVPSRTQAPGGPNAEAPKAGAQGVTRGAAKTQMRVVAHTRTGRPLMASMGAFSRAVQRVNFSVIDKKTEDEAQSTADRIGAAVARAVSHTAPLSDLQKWLKSHANLTSTIDISGGDRGRIKALAAYALNEAFKLGDTTAANELDKARGEVTPHVVKARRFVNLRDNAAQYFEAKAYKVSGDISDKAAGIMQNEILNGIKYGLSPGAVRANIWDRLVSVGLTTRDQARANEGDEAVNNALDALWQDTEEGALAYLNTAIRTTMFEALNEARFAEFTDPSNSNYVLALEYAAVLDDSTTEICRELNGTVLEADDPAWDDIRPPNHFNCRSVLVPITADDNWDGKTDKVPDVKPATGFGAGGK